MMYALVYKHTGYIPSMNVYADHKHTGHMYRSKTYGTRVQTLNIQDMCTDFKQSGHVC